MRRISLLALPLIALAGCGQQQPAQAPDANAAATTNATQVEATGTAAPPAATAANGRISTFTVLDNKACGPERIIEETGDWDRECDGAGNFALEWGSGDLREDLTIIEGGKRTALGIPETVANGAFDSIGKTLEWRGPQNGRPDVLVARVHVAGPDGNSDSGSLAVVRLTPSPCIVAIVRPQAGQSEKARAVADGTLPACLKT